MVQKTTEIIKSSFEAKAPGSLPKVTVGNYSKDVGKFLIKKSPLCSLKRL